MLQVRVPILYFFLLVLGILLDFGPDASHKQGGFSKTLPEKGFQFVPSRRDGIVAFNLSFVLLPAEVNPISEQQGREGDAFVARDSGRIKMILTLSPEIVALHMQAPIVKVGVPGFEGSITGGRVCLAIFLALDQQFQSKLGGSLQIFVCISPRRA